MSLPIEISVNDVQRMHASGEAFTLLDVREDDELDIVELPWAKHIPVAAVSDRLGELPRDGDIVVMCHGGTRSSRVARYLRERGFSSVANLTGGIDAWAAEIDPSLERY